MATLFPIDNLPYGVISTADNPTHRCATVLEDQAIDLSALENDGVFKDIQGFEGPVFSQPTLNTFAALPKDTHRAVRTRLVEALGSSDTQAKYGIPLTSIQNHLPMATSNFSDFYCSLEHAQNCSKIMNLPIPDNWFCIPSVYNGRTSSLRVSGTSVRRPHGVYQTSSTSAPEFQPSRRFDFELEVGVFISRPFPPGAVLDIAHAQDHIFGLVILNDWSARDIQGFEMKPLGPFHSKGSGTSISPWIVTLEALEAVACGVVGVTQDPPPLRHLAWSGDKEKATFDVNLEARVIRNGKKYQVTQTNLNELYWTPYQQVAHLTSAGEGLTTGDIFGTGTISSARTDPTGVKTGIACLLERSLSENRLDSLQNDGVVFLENGDEVVMEGWCVSRVTGRKFGFGECRGLILPSVELN